MANIHNTIKDIAKSDRNISDLKAIVHEKIKDTDLKDLFTIRTGIKTGDQVIASQAYSGLLKKRDQEDVPNYRSLSDIEGDLIGQRYELQKIYLDVEYHISYLATSFLDYLTENSLREADLRDSNQTFIEFVAHKIIEGVEIDLTRLALMGDADIASKNVLYVNGNQDNSRSDLFDGIKMGLIPSLVYFQTLGGDLSNNIEINKISLDSTSYPLSLSGGKAQELLLDTDDTIFEGDSYYMNKAMYLNYAKSLKENAYLESSKSELTGGVMYPYNGKPIRLTATYDRAIKAHFKNGLNYYFPHFIVKTDKSNLVLALSSDDILSDLEIAYDIRSEKVLFKSSVGVDFKIINPYHVRAIL